MQVGQNQGRAKPVLRKLQQHQAQPSQKVLMAQRECTDQFSKVGKSVVGVFVL